MDIAPDSSLYIATPRSNGDVRNAVDWMTSEGVSVIAYPLGDYLDGPGDGTSPFGDSPLNTVDRAVDAGAVWLSAAGNEALSTWLGPYSAITEDGTTLLTFEGDDITNGMILSKGDFIVAELRWDDDWAGASRDLDLLIWDFASSEYGASSFDLQTGRPGQVPHERLGYSVPADGLYAVVVGHDNGSVPDWVHLTVTGPVVLEHYTGSSITNPAESANPGMLAVGAAPWYDVHEIEWYSSQGPTLDGRVKPDIAGADCGSGALEEPEWRGFCGASQSTPHVAGLAALVRQRFPDMTPAEVTAYLKEHAEQREEPDPNDNWGHGFAVLPVAAVIPVNPTITGVGVATNLAPVRLDRPIPVTVTFSKPMTGFTFDDLDVTNGTAGNFAGEDGDAVYTFDVTPVSVAEVTVGIAAGVAMDGDGNGNEVFQLSLGIPYDDDGDGGISKGEVLTAIVDYLFDDRITRAQVLEVIVAYLFSD